MNRRIWTDLVKLIFFFGLLFLVFVVVVDFFTDEKADTPNKEDNRLVSIEQEVRLGGFLSEMYIEQLDKPKAPLADSVVSVIAARLTSKLDSDLFEYEFHIVEDESVNAFTFPGGHIVINTGLLRFSRSAEEVAAVLAHEIGHAQNRHVVDKLITEVGMSIVFLVITGGDPGVMHDLMKSVVACVFSRNQEEEADSYGLQLMDKAGIHPSALADFFRRLSKENPGFSEEFEWIMSHPHNEKRIAKSENYEVRVDFKESVFKMNWEKVLAEL